MVSRRHFSHKPNDCENVVNVLLLLIKTSLFPLLTKINLIPFRV